jgi:hypothetical protein
MSSSSEETSEVDAPVQRILDNFEEELKSLDNGPD